MGKVRRHGLKIQVSRGGLGQLRESAASFEDDEEVVANGVFKIDEGVALEELAEDGVIVEPRQ